ncbi:MAG: NUDIX domain-containing protein [Candidatus Magasanikbacteria bacterium]|jgi:ADP-ribose pyrophosphatase YjhB (NUDIX family)
MPVTKIGKSKEGFALHYSVGAVIKRADKYFLLDRANEPFGFACVAGHVEEGETVEFALARETEEESGLQIISKKLLFEEEVEKNKCSRGVFSHYWYVFDCETTGETRLDSSEAKSIGWFTVEEIKKLKLEPIWEYWFKKMGVI